MAQSLTIYKASAGSGKTFTLAIEYIMQFLETHDKEAFKHILAVTFTNKATAEMKNRIIEMLYAIANNLPEADGYLKAISERMGDRFNRDKVQETARESISAILHDYSYFRVETIDSFFQSILRNMARELGLSANLQVELSYKEVISEAVDAIITSMDNDQKLHQWVLDYVNEQLEQGEKWDITKPLKKFAEQIFDEAYQNRSEEELRTIGDNTTVEQFKRKMHAIITPIEKRVKEAADLLEKQLNQDGNHFNRQSLNNGKTVVNFIAKARDMKPGASLATIMKMVNGTTDMVHKDYRKDENVKAEVPYVQGLLAELVTIYDSNMKDYLSAKLALRHINQLRLLVNIDMMVKEINKETNNFCLASTPVLLSKMIKGCDAPFVFEKIGTQMSYIMIDEFQDTSHMQWNNFKTLLFEELSKGGKGLLVGDVKQSIYRWRDGDWRILHGISDEIASKGLKAACKPLNTNYRSKEQIVEFNNQFFVDAAKVLDEANPDSSTKIAGIYSDDKEDENYVRQEVKKRDGEGFVSMTIFKEENKRGKKKDTEETLEEADTQVCFEERMITDMAGQIRSLNEQGLPLEKMAILVRTNKNGRDLINGFCKYAPDIKLVSDEAFLLSASKAVQMIISALRVIVDRRKEDKVAMTYLKYYYQREIAGRTDVTIEDAALDNEHTLLPDGLKCLSLLKGEDTQETDVQVKPKSDVRACFDYLRQLPLLVLSETLYRVLGLEKMTDEHVFVLTLLDEMEHHLHGNAPDIQTFLEAWEETIQKRAIPCAANSGIRILTIHKSKGLEFHTVLLPYCEWSIERDHQDDMLWSESENNNYADLGLLPIPSYAVDIRHSVFRQTYEEEHMERRIDSINTLYVAFTRAGANLYAWGKVTKGEKTIATGAQLIYQTLKEKGNDDDDGLFRYTAGVPVITTGEKKEGKSDNRMKIVNSDENAILTGMVSHNASVKIWQSNQSQRFLRQLQDEDGKPIRLSNREVGTRMHEILSRVTDATEVGSVIDESRKEGLITDNDDWNRIVRRTIWWFKDPLVRSWFANDCEVFNECNIAGRDKYGKPCILRPDRVVIKDRTITVVDYKFGFPNDDYENQVCTYMQQLGLMYPGHTVNGYLWYIMGKGPKEIKNKK